jgi:hypothetical protein
LPNVNCHLVPGGRYVDGKSRSQRHLPVPDFYRIGKRIMYKRAEVVAWFDSHENVVRLSRKDEDREDEPPRLWNAWQVAQHLGWTMHRLDHAMKN